MHRENRHRVVDSPNDPRLQEQRFQRAPAIFANNDVKYDTNKKRAQRVADDTNALVTYAVAKDTVSSAALVHQPGLGTEKKRSGYVAMIENAGIYMACFYLCKVCPSHSLTI